MDNQDNGAWEKGETYRRIGHALEVLKDVKYLFVVNNRGEAFSTTEFDKPTVEKIAAAIAGVLEERIGEMKEVK
jgi:hypothetical protein